MSYLNPFIGVFYFKVCIRYIVALETISSEREFDRKDHNVRVFS
jgi:hypothetical protein